MAAADEGKIVSYKYGVGRGLIDDYLAGERGKDWVVNVGRRTGVLRIVALQCSFVRWQGTCIIQDFRAQTAEIGQMSECQNGMLVRPNT